MLASRIFDDTHRSYEVVVVGAGPAGSLLAARLAAAGVRVLVIEASAFDRQRAGEFLTPKARAAVNATGVLPEGWELHHRTVHEFVGTWGSTSHFGHNFIFDARGHGLTLDRVAFDRELAYAAAARGAILLTRAGFLAQSGIGTGGRSAFVTAGNALRCAGVSRPYAAGGQGRPLRAFPREA
jgi:flavin-dependent dehydrogenase